MEAYLDNSATTKCSRRVQEIVLRTMDAAFGNPSSMHRKGMEAELYVKEAAARIAKTLKVSEKEIVFTSGGTESNNLAMIGAAYANQRAGRRIITTQIEHASVFQAAEFLKTQGFEIIYLPVDADGVISLDALREAVNDETILVSIMQVNNEIGTVQPIEQAAAVIHEKNPGTLVHVDAVQAYGKMRIRPRKMGIDLLSVSGHKIHAPKGIGFLYRKEKTKLKPMLYGGGQQGGLRPGTQNVPGIAGLGEAAVEIYEDFEEKIEHLKHLRERFLAQTADIEGIQVNGIQADGGTSRESAPHIVSVSFSGIRSEVLLHALEEKGIYVSAGSACSSNQHAVSRTLQALHIDPKLLDSTLRFSFSNHTQIEEIDYTAACLKNLLPMLRRYARR